MAERQGEADAGIEAVQDVPMPHNHQLEVNAVAGNQGGGSAKREPSDLLNMICLARKISMPQCSPIAVHGERTRKIYQESVCVPEMKLTETGNGYSKKKAQGEAARMVLNKLRVAGERKEKLGDVTQEVVQKCYQMLNKYVLTEPKSEAEKEICFSIGTLRCLEQADGRPRSVFKLVEESGPDRNNVMSFTVTCTQGEHVTRGTGPSKKDAENKAAYEMCRFLQQLPM